MPTSQRIVLYKYICLNQECANHSHQFVKKQESESEEEEPCIACLQPMKLLGEVMYGGIGGNFRQSTPEQRKQMLLKRSSKHFQQSGLAERKRALGEEYKRQAIEHFKKG